jgi:iron complex outermembrane recepter protein
MNSRTRLAFAIALINGGVILPLYAADPVTDPLSKKEDPLARREDPLARRPDPLARRVVEEPKAAKPATPAKTPAAVKPAEAKPVEVKPVEVTPAEIKPLEVKQVEAKPTEVKPMEAKPMEAKPVPVKPAAVKPKASSTKVPSTTLPSATQTTGDVMVPVKKVVKPKPKMVAPKPVAPVVPVPEVIRPQLAASSDDADVGLLEEIVVTATKRETALTKTPIAITVLSQETLTQGNIVNAKDIAKLVPNMSMTFDAAETAPVISMRGVRSTNTTELGDPAIGLHLDGIYSPRPQGAMSLLFDVERVEAQRGPQGTLFGRNSTVGNINIISKRPKMEEFDAEVGAQYGSFNNAQVHGMANIPFGETLAVRVSLIKETRDSYLNGYYDANQFDTRFVGEEARNAPLETAPLNFIQRTRGFGGGPTGSKQVVAAKSSSFYNNVDQYAARITGLWEPTDNVSWMLALERFQDSGAGNIETVNCDLAAKRGAANSNCDGIYGVGADEYTVNVNVPGKQDQTISSLRSNFRWDFSEEMALVYNAGLAHQTLTKQIDIERGLDLTDQAQFIRDAQFDSQSHELQIQSTGDGDLQWIAGVFVFQEKNFMEKIYSVTQYITFDFLQPERTLASAAGFAQGVYKLTDDLNITLGYRHTEDSKEDVGGHNKRCNSAPEPGDTKICTPNTYAAYNALSKDYFFDDGIYTNITNNDNKYSEGYDNYRLGVDYTLNDDTFLFGYLANGTKSGGIGDVGEQKVQDPLTALPVIDPATGQQQIIRYENIYNKEEVITLEAGVKADFFDKTLRLSAAAFYSDYRDLQFSSPKTLYTTYRLQGTTVIPQPVIVFQTENIGKARITGLELEFEWAPTRNDRLTGFATFLSTAILGDFTPQWNYAAGDLFKVDPQNDALNPVLYQNLKGNELPDSPNFTFNINYNHIFDFDNGMSLTPWIGTSWRAESYYSIYNVDKFEDSVFVSTTPEAYSDTRPSSLNVNIGIKYSGVDDTWNVEAFVNNATDEVEFYGAASRNGVVGGVVSMPRFFGVRGSYKF